MSTFRAPLPGESTTVWFLRKQAHTLNMPEKAAQADRIEANERKLAEAFKALGLKA